MSSSEDEAEDVVRNNALGEFKRIGVKDPEKYYMEIAANETQLSRLQHLLEDDRVGTSSQKTTFEFEFQRFSDLVPGWTAIGEVLNRIKAGEKEGVDSSGAISAQSAARLKQSLAESTQSPAKRAWSDVNAFDQQQQSEHVHMFFSDFTWADHNVTGVRDINKLFPIRYQKENQCFWQSVALIEHYIVAIQSQGRFLEMLDIGAYIRGRLDNPEDLHRVLTVGHRPGSALHTLIEMMGLNNEQYEEFSVKKQRYEEMYLAIKKGPILVSNFRVETDFLSPAVKGKASYTNTPKFKEGDPTHTMVMLAIRRDNRGDYFCLLQNYWSSKFLVEVSMEYLEACGSHVAHFQCPHYERKAILKKYVAAVSFTESCLDIPEGGIED